MGLNKKQRHYLRTLAHHRKPVVIIGSAGLTEAVLGEIENALAHHELIKIRVNAGDRHLRKRMVGEIASRTGAELVQQIGHIASYYRPAEERVIQFPA